MSKVYSFRLDGDNPREAQAREVIDVWVSQGYSLRHILTEALISYGDNSYVAKEWDRVYDQLSELVRGLDDGVWDKQSIGNNPELSLSFISSMKKSVKKGIVSG